MKHKIGLMEGLALYQEHYLSAQKRAPKTRIEYTNDLKDLFSFLRAKVLVGRPDQVERKHLDRYLGFLDGRGYLSSTARRKVASIRSFFSFLQEASIIAINPAQNLTPPARLAEHLRVLTGDECQRLRDAARCNIRDTTIIEVLLHTGIGLSECARLRLEDISLPVGGTQLVRRITITGRNGRRRMLPLADEASAAIARYVAIRSKANSPALFITKFEKRLGPRSIENIVHKHLRNAGIFDASVHSLRHTYATRMVMAGAEIDVVKERLGHASVKTTVKYTNLATSDSFKIS